MKVKVLRDKAQESLYEYEKRNRIQFSQLERAIYVFAYLEGYTKRWEEEGDL